MTEAENSEYMYVYHNVGGQITEGKYEYYVWYLKGSKYHYNVDLTGYIGVKDTEFRKNASLSVEQERYFVMTGVDQTKALNNMDLESMYQNTWNADSDSSDRFAAEIGLVLNQRSSSGIQVNARSIGYLGYETVDGTPSGKAKKDDKGNLIWGIWRLNETAGSSDEAAGGNKWRFQAGKGDSNSFQVTEGDALALIGSDVVSAQLKFTLHKGTQMITEFRNLPFTMNIVEVEKGNYEEAVKDNTKSIEEDSCIRLSTDLNLSIIRLVPTQAAYMGTGRLFAGVSSSSTVNVTDTSAFTAQFVTKYIPSAFNAGLNNRITETLVTEYADTYLLDENGVGYTIKEDADGKIELLNVTNTSDSDVKSYVISKNPEDGSYSVSYMDGSGNVLADENGRKRTYSCKAQTQTSGFVLPKGTTITLLASMDEANPTYWYYYCTEDTSQVELSKFKEMNSAQESTSSRSIYDEISSTNASRVTENLIFVFDFEKVDNADWKADALQGNIMLKHVYQNGIYKTDIMDYVSSESTTEDGVDKVTYSRMMPRQTENFKINKDTDGIKDFRIVNGDISTEYGPDDQMNFNLEVIPNTDVTNTQYEEREYAVILTLRKKGESESSPEIAFPEGTIVTFSGKQLVVGKDNQYVIVPVKTVGKHLVQIRSGLYGFDAGTYELVAKLYSTSEEGYYNSIKVSEASTEAAGFTILPKIVYSLKVEEQSGEKQQKAGNHIVSPGETLNFQVITSGDQQVSANAVQVHLYQYLEKAYVKTELNTVLDKTELFLTENTGTWNATVAEEAKKGIYRLEFTYHDKTEYWDFIVK